MDKLKEFSSELKALLEKYHAEIGVRAHEDSDWRGIYDEEVYAEIGGETTTLGYGLVIDSSDIRNV